MDLTNDFYKKTSGKWSDVFFVRGRVWLVQFYLYSLLSASNGSMLAALLAGYMEATTLMMTENSTATNANVHEKSKNSKSQPMILPICVLANELAACDANLPPATPQMPPMSPISAAST